LHGTLEQTHSAGDTTQKKSLKHLKLALYTALILILLIFGEHLSRNSLLPLLAPRVDGTSSTLSVKAFSLLQRLDSKLCKALKCQNRSISDFAAWKIISATLTPENAQEGLKTSANQSVLQVEIQNRLAIPVLPVNLEISFTDAEESELNSIQLTPKEWLPQVWQESHPDFSKVGIPSGEIIHAEVPLTLPPNAAGYRVHVMYPQ
jgi:ribosomal protein L11 methyltransferase